MADSHNYEVLPAVKTLLNVATINNFPSGDMQVGNHVYFTRTGEIEVSMPEAPWIRIIAMPLRGPGQIPDFIDRVQNYKFNIRVDVQPPSDNPEEFDTGVTHSLVQEKIFSLLENVKPALSNARVLSPFRRVARPGPPSKDLKSGFDTTASTWQIHLGKL